MGFVIKMTLIAGDLMVSNPRVKELGYAEEALGHNAIAGGFQGQRQWTDHFPNGDFMEAILCSSFDWIGIRQPFMVATENDSLNGVSMLFGHLLTGSAQVFSDVRTNPSWPTTWFVPNLTGQGAFTDVYNVMANWGANHGAFSYGHIGADLISLAAMLRIPFNMHNVPEETIFRPSVWSSFGMDKEGADYRACSNFGPLYR